ncbi:Fumagillin beta-trans-bergamotene synthase [Lachnellula suecica]|uniref:Fumagillin beta-trans-bergamotene synthase n=1 Tax=Lachnellula suecica TaxID=602035 RepID=A0A8T9CH32_9HELO|nr:Fumagillin beta-trans-bergamotene synthase [Lachnellula suecica]
MASFKKNLRRWSYNLYSIWLFTFSDIKTIIAPSTAFGLVNAIAVSLNSRAHVPSSSGIFIRTPLVAFWVWINLLPFAIDNQRQPDSIQEDLINKPWRTMPSRRLSPDAAKRIMLCLYPIAIIVSLALGNILQCIALICLGFWYNDLKGSDSSFAVRNFINACGFVCFASGAMQVAIGQHESALKLLGWWSPVVACIVFSTVQTQDMYDQRGDAVRNRKTLPLVIGDGPARWTIAIPMIMWCFFAPWLWKSSVAGYVAPVSLGLIIAARTLWKRSEKQDKTTFRFWNLWLVCVYLLPLIKATEGNLALWVV